MSALPVVLCICLSFSTATRERWVGEDKLKHLAASFVATSMAASAARIAGADAVPSAWIGAAAGASVGVLKEARDLRTGRGTPSIADLAWDLAGVGFATALLSSAR